MIRPVVRTAGLLISLTAGALSFLGSLSPAQAEIVRARYSVSLVGLHIGEAAAVSSLDDKYRIDFNAKLTGVAAMVADVKMALTSTGTMRPGAVIPATYATTSANSRESRTVRMALPGGNVRAVDISPPWEDRDGRVPVTESNKRNILDPTSAFIMPVADGQPLVGPAACNRRIPVYDGFVRFDITLMYRSTRNVELGGYSGPVSVCAARYTPIAGHKRDSRSTRFMAENRQIEVWLAPIPRAHVVAPLRVQLMTLAGEALIEAVEFSVQPSDFSAATH